jgi:large subunit ribosomal protein L29
MKAKDLHERTVEDLRELEKTISKDLFEARFKNFTNRLDDTATLRKHRREIARIKTVLGEKGRGGMPATQKSPVVAEEHPVPKAKASKPEIPVATASKPAPSKPAPSKPAPSKPAKPAAKKVAASPKKPAAAKKTEKKK